MVDSAKTRENRVSRPLVGRSFGTKFVCRSIFPTATRSYHFAGIPRIPVKFTPGVRISMSLTASRSRHQPTGPPGPKRPSRSPSLRRRSPVNTSVATIPYRRVTSAMNVRNLLHHPRGVLLMTSTGKETSSVRKHAARSAALERTAGKVMVPHPSPHRLHSPSQSRRPPLLPSPRHRPTSSTTNQHPSAVCWAPVATAASLPPSSVTPTAAPTAINARPTATLSTATPSANNSLGSSSSYLLLSHPF